MKTWTYLEAKTKVQKDLDLQDELFVTPDEMSGYFNEGIKEAQAEILELHQDYYLTFDYVPLANGVGQYPMPWNIYGNKLRGVIYQNGAIVYPVHRVRRNFEFQSIANTEIFGQAEDYRFYLTTDSYGTQQFNLLPNSRIDDPLGAGKYLKRWYMRSSNRMPVIGEYCNPENFSASAVNTGAGTISVIAGTVVAPGTTTYVTGDAVKIVNFGGTMPGGLTAGVVYYVIAATATTIKLATTLANALAGTAITLTSTGTGVQTLTVAATTAIQNNILIDIPEFIEFIMAWVKQEVLAKDGDPRFDTASSGAEKQRKMMQDTLNQMVDDDQDTIQADFSHYTEMS